MDALHVRITEELVTLGPRSAGVSEVSTSAPHLTPREFHAAAADASRAASTVLIDTRNAYEHAVGRLDFAAEGGAPTLLPPSSLIMRWCLPGGTAKSSGAPRPLSIMLMPPWAPGMNLAVPPADNMLLLPEGSVAIGYLVLLDEIRSPRVYSEVEHAYR